MSYFHFYTWSKNAHNRTWLKSCLTGIINSAKEALSTLHEYVVNMRGVQIQKPNDELSRYILEKMCQAAAGGIKLQCGREYGFADANQTLRASDISGLTKTQLLGLPTNNLAAERNLAIFDKRAAKASQSRNKKLTGASTRNDLCLH